MYGDAGLDVQRVQQVDERVWAAIQNRRTLEVSTGLFTDNIPTMGIFNGREFFGIATNHKPDHLAVLPDQIGACSIADGCGLNRNTLCHTDVAAMIEREWETVG
jgi:hypothetical protein